MLLIYTSTITNRLQYIMAYLFNEQLGVEYMLYDDKEAFLTNNSLEKIVYAEENINDSLYFFSNQFLFESDIKEFKLYTGSVNEMPVLFKHDKKDALGFDVFAAVFYVLSRYEEYLNKPTDKFGNYDYQNSILYELKVLHLPVVELWLNMLKATIKQKFPSIQFKQSTASFVLSFDIDVAYAYQNRSWLRTIGGIAKKIFRLQFSALADQLLTILHFKNDMFDTYQYIFSKIKTNKAIFFFNMGSYSAYDKNPSYKNKTFRKLIKRIHAKHITGLHPSYASNSNKILIAHEKQWLEEIINDQVFVNRQHYLKLKFPYTYQQLIENGMQYDFTIGYHDAYGFRAGTCKPFLFFDLKKNKVTHLRLLPFAIMEGTLNDVMHLSIEASKKIITDLINIVSENEGIFIPLWHNSTLSNKEHWKGWREVFEHMLNEIENKKLINFVDSI